MKSFFESGRSGEADLIGSDDTRKRQPRWIRMMKDYGIEYSDAGQAATQPAWRKPRTPQRGRPQMPFNPDAAEDRARCA